MPAKARHPPSLPPLLPALTTGATVVGAALFAALLVAASQQFPLLPFIAMGAALALAVAVAQPLLVVSAGVVAIPLEGYTHAIIGPSQAVMGVAAVGWLIRWAASRSHALPRHPALIAFAVLVVANVTGLLFADEPDVVFRQVGTWGTMLLVAACVADTQGTAGVRRLLLAFAVSGGLAGAIALADPQPLTAHVYGGGEVDRATAGLGSPNALGILLGMALPIQLTFMLRGPVSTRIVGTGCFALSLAGMALSVSRGAFIGLAVALLVLAFWGPFRRAAMIVLPLVVVLAIVGKAPATTVTDGSRIVERLTELGSDRVTNLRWPLWKATPEMIADHPFFGVGALEYGHSAASYGILSSQGTPPHAHNTALTIAAELGLVGLAAFLALVASLVAGLTRIIRRAPRDAQAMAFSLAAAFTVFLVGGVVDYVLGAPPIAAAVFVLVGATVALTSQARSLLAVGGDQSATPLRGNRPPSPLPLA